MNSKLAILAALLAVILHANAKGDFVFSISDTPLVNNSTNQKLQIFLSWNGNGVSQVAGMNLFAEIRNPEGALSVPIFQGTQGTRSAFGFSSTMVSGSGFTTTGETIWDSDSFTAEVSASGAAPELTNARRATVSVLSNDLSGFNFLSLPNTPRLVGEFSINTIGTTDQRFNLFFGAIGGSSTDIVFTDATSISLSNRELSFSVGNVTAVPEPSSLVSAICMLALVGGGCLVRKRQRNPRSVVRVRFDVDLRHRCRHHRIDGFIV